MSVYLYARVSTDKQENLFPMCEGVDRHAATGSRPGLTLPRVRGGGPPLSGCVTREAALYPVCAGVDRSVTLRLMVAPTLPRVRGGGPPPPEPHENYENSSPCARG